jgi:hypothetical protein
LRPTALEPSRVRAASTDGRTEILDHKLGDVFWSDATAHSLEAIAGEVHEIEAEIKPAMPLSTSHSAREVSELFPQLARVVFENERVRVVDLRGEPSQAFPLHFHPPRVMVRLGAARMKVTDPDGKTRLSDQQFGFTSWGDPVQHSDAVVIGVFHVIDIELKPPSRQFGRRVSRTWPTWLPTGACSPLLFHCGGARRRS